MRWRTCISWSTLDKVHQGLNGGAWPFYILSKETKKSRHPERRLIIENINKLSDELLSLIRHGEDIHTEYKEAIKGFPKNVYDTVSSFSNREGGDIFLGVEDYSVVTGIAEKDIPHYIQQFVTAVNNEDKINPPLYLTPIHYVFESDGFFIGTDKNGKKHQEEAGTYHILYIHVPVSPNVIRNSGKIYDRNGDADIDITSHFDLVYQCYARKQTTYYVNKVFPYWSVSDLRKDLIDRARDLANNKKQRAEKKDHQWTSMSDEEMIRTSGLYLTDENGKKGITLAAVLLFGSDDMIASACAHHKTDCIYRVYNLDRYDDRDVITTNLLDSYDRMFDFGQKHLNDLFVLDGIQSVSARDAILRESISNTLEHRDFSSPYIAKMIIERDKITFENGNRAHGIGVLDIKNFEPWPKNPSISKIFREIGYADELGSGMRNSYKYTKLYSGAEPEFIEGDVFKTIIPLSTGAMIKVGGQVSGQDSGQAGGQADGQAVTISLDAGRLRDLLEYCSEPRTRAEMQTFCNIKSRDYFRTKILVPLIESGRIFLTIPDKPSSPKQKYYSKK